MRRRGIDGISLGALRSLIGALSFGALTASLFLAPTSLSGLWNRPESGAVEADSEVVEYRTVIGVELLDLQAGDDFLELANQVAEDENSTWESVCRLMEDRGVTELSYTIRVAWAFDDGSIEEMTYLRRPYQDPSFALEFLHLLRVGRTGSIVGVGLDLHREHHGELGGSVFERLVVDLSLKHGGDASPLTPPRTRHGD